MQREATGHERLARAGVVIHAFLVIGIPLLFLVGGLVLGKTDSWVFEWRSLTWIALVIAPLVIAYVGQRQPSALLVAGVATVVLSIALFLFAFILWIPAMFYFVAYGRAGRPQVPSVMAPGLVTGLVVALAIASLWSMFQTEQRCYDLVRRVDGSEVKVPDDGSDASRSTPEGEIVGSGCGSDTTVPGSVAAFVGAALIAAAGITLTRPAATPVN